MSYAVHHADAITYLRGRRWLVQNGYLPRYHAVLCDPPYGLAFMGKEWDTFGAHEFQAWVTEWAGLLLDYVYPGGVLMAFGGTRTYHRLAAGLEDAGWEIVDSMCWVTGQGFPKSMALDKAINKEAGAAREVVGPRIRLGDKQPYGGDAFGKHQIYQMAQGSSDLTAPATPLAARWEGYGTALKPAYEPVVIARAPRGKRTYAALAREFGTGALAIDAARIGYQDNADWQGAHGGNSGSESRHVYNAGLKGRPQSMSITPAGRFPANFALVCACEGDDHADDCPVSVLGRQSGETRAGKVSGTGKTPGVGPNSWFTNGEAHRSRYDDEPVNGAARFFYQAKAAAWEREAGLPSVFPVGPPPDSKRSTPAEGRQNALGAPRRNHHPTVKPIRMAEYLATLLLPPPLLDEPRRLLVPFAGSGSEMIGAMLAGWDDVTGIEREAEYMAIARARVGWWAQFSTYDEARAAYEKERKAKPALVVTEDKPAQIALFPNTEEAV